jgi:tRNA threonylcarbamoyladenosine biosynthesis protein TsaE
VLALEGDLGAGKTTFVRGLGVTGDITSPSFALLNAYEGAVRSFTSTPIGSRNRRPSMTS